MLCQSNKGRLTPREQIKQVYNKKIGAGIIHKLLSKKQRLSLHVNFDIPSYIGHFRKILTLMKYMEKYTIP
jgi:hypothetical protein